ncbi:hypothetical protein [Thiocystis violacea]|uniref:hypothetical protein n=1 Tax=Thiocystis violacea TaxID=13725 RepID=UPI001906551A|nr:hypothetical protein [Thiocystis violacea]MBK1724548.1 hypothetical protein [Thiocystis violacea]
MLIALLGGFLLLLIGGILGGDGWSWKKVTFVVTTSFALFVVATVPDHFLTSTSLRRAEPKRIEAGFNSLHAMGALPISGPSSQESSYLDRMRSASETPLGTRDFVQRGLPSSLCPLRLGMHRQVLAVIEIITA